MLRFSWSIPLVEAAGERSIKREDYGGLQEEDTMEVLSQKIEDSYFAQNADNRNFIFAVIDVFRWDVAVIMALSLLEVACGMIDPLIMRWLSEHITSGDADLSRGLWLLFLLVGSQVREYLHGEFQHYFNHCMGVKARHAIGCMVMRKAIR